MLTHTRSVLVGLVVTVLALSLALVFSEPPIGSTRTSIGNGRIPDWWQWQQCQEDIVCRGDAR